MRRVSWGAAIAVFGVLLAGCGPRVAQAQALSLTYSSGDRYQYKLHMTSDSAINFGGMPATFKTDLSAIETVTVKSVDASGNADVGVALTQVTMKSVGGDAQNPSSTTTTISHFPDITLKVGPDGRILSVNGVSSAFGLMTTINGGPGFVSAVLPDNPVKPGDVWSKDYDQPNPGDPGGAHITTKSKYLRDETLKDVKAAVVETTSNLSFDLTMEPGALGPPIPDSPQSGIPGVPSGAIGPGSFEMKGSIDSVTTSWIDPAKHRMLKTQMHGTYDLTTSINTPPDMRNHMVVTSVGLKGTQKLDLTSYGGVATSSPPASQDNVQRLSWTK
jgi:hypothetical protein